MATKKQPTPAQIAARQKFGEQAKARAAAKRAQTNTPNQTDQPTQPVASPSGDTITMSNEQFQALLSALNPGTADKQAPPAFSTRPEVGTNGQMTGTYTPYNPDKTYYPDPRDRLMAEFETDPKTKRIGLADNYWLEWDVTAKPYQNVQGIWVQEPTFIVTLYSNQYDEEGDLTGGSVLIQTLHLNEDKGIAFEYAKAQGLEPTDDNMRYVMDEARFHRISTWLHSVFFPPKALNKESNQQIVDGQVMTVVSRGVSRDEAENRSNALNMK